MAINPVSGIASAGAGGASAGLAENFETFLTLLTEQMKNQDPLSPMDSTEFVNQLVQFSSVEQQINQNNNLETLIGLQLAASQAGAGTYLGREVTAATPDAELADGNAEWTYTLPSAAKSARLLVEDSKGKLVYVTDGKISAGAHQFAWDGKNALGVALPDGVYTLSVAALDEAGEKITASIENRGRVTAVDFSGAAPELLIGKLRVPMSDVRSLREYASGEGAQS